MSKEVPHGKDQGSPIPETGERLAPSNGSNVFISYPRVEQPFVRTICRLIEGKGLDAWIDWQDIRPSEDWLKRILSEIERMGTMVVVITPESCASTICNLEVNHAAKLGKRLIPVMRRETPRESVNEHLRALNWIFCREQDDLETEAAQLISAIQTDLEWIDEQASVLTRALEWDRGGRTWSATLRGAGLNRAESWLARADGTTRVATSFQREYIAASRRAVARFRTGSGLTAVLLMVLSVLAPWMWHRSRIKERDAIDAQFALDVNSSPSPLDLTRRASLEQLRSRADSVGYQEVEVTIRREIERIPSAVGRVEVLRADDTRRGLATAGDGDRIFLWAHDRIECLAGVSTNEVDVIYRPAGGRIVWAKGDSCADGMLAEVDFETFADPTMAACVTSLDSRKYLKHKNEHAFEGEKEFESLVVGNDRAVYFVPGSGVKAKPTELLGMTSKLELIGLAGDRDGNIIDYVFLARNTKDTPSREGLVENRYSSVDTSTEAWREYGAGLKSGILSVASQNVRVVPLARAAGGAASLLDVSYSGIQRTSFMDKALGPMKYEFIAPVVQSGAGAPVPLAKTTIFSVYAPIYDQADAFKNLGLTNVRPNFSPAALDMVRRQAILRDQWVKFTESTPRVATKIHLDWAAVVDVRFTIDGETLLVRYHDRGAGLYNLPSNRLTHRFPGPNPSVRDVAVDPRGKYVFVLESNGALIRWDFAAFGPDGWASNK